MSPNEQQASRREDDLPIGSVVKRSPSTTRKFSIIALAVFLVSCVVAYILISSARTQPAEVSSEMVSVSSG